MPLRLAFLSGIWATVLFSQFAARAEDHSALKVRLTWGHRSTARAAFHVKLSSSGAEIAAITGSSLEADEGLREGAWQTQSSGGDVDGVEFVLRYPSAPPKRMEKLNPIWADLIAQSDADTARRLRSDPALRLDDRKITVQMDQEGHRGFSVAVCQLLENQAIWVPSLDAYLATGPSPEPFDDHHRELQRWQGKRILDQVHREPEATYEQYTALWEDMGSPNYKHPSQPEPGHIVCLSWDSSLPKFGVDRGAGVWNDLGNPDHFRLWFDFGDGSQGMGDSWKGQALTDALPVITTVRQRDKIRYEVEQFAYPLEGPPADRRGDLAMVLLQKLRIVNLDQKPRHVEIVLKHRRELPADSQLTLVAVPDVPAWTLEDKRSHVALLCVQGPDIKAELGEVAGRAAQQGQKEQSCELRFTVELRDHGTRDLIVKLPSPVLAASDRHKLLALDYEASRTETLRFWTGYLARGAEFRVPEKAVNDLFRASLWHALRLPRRHGAEQPELKIDLPYSNFAYGQRGIPWPVNQAVYVDYMLYDLRGYYDLAAEELAAIYREGQEANGHVQGYANWVVYTPAMLYSVAKHYLLCGDRRSLDRLMPPTLKALDWCLAEIERNRQREGASAGLVHGPLNDGTGAGLWAFNQAYLYAGLDLLGQVLAQTGHPRAAECQKAAGEFRRAVNQAFSAATIQAPLVQLRDHTWIPYVPCEVLTPRRLFDQWYPTDVDTGALHLPRLKALPPESPLTEYLLHDHEDNLFLRGWGMANEPVYNQQATAYLLRDNPKAAIRAFYSYMACAFSHSVYEPVEHRWTWGQYFGPPSTDGAWFELYRHLLIDERDGDTLLLLQATPRKWLEDGKRIEVRRAPTYFGNMSMTIESRAASGKLLADIEMPRRRNPASLWVRFRHPAARSIRSVTVNGEQWTDFDAQKEWVRIVAPNQPKYSLVVSYD